MPPGSTRCSLTDGHTGISFPANVSSGGRALIPLGCGVRKKQLLGPIALSIYAVALFVERAEAAAALPGGVAVTAGALLDGEFVKTLYITFAREVTPAQFLAALGEELGKRLGGNACQGVLDDFSAFVRGSRLDKGSSILLTWRPADEVLDVNVLPPGAGSPPASFASQAFARALFDVYLGKETIVPEARDAWVAGAKKLLQSV